MKTSALKTTQRFSPLDSAQRLKGGQSQSGPVRDFAPVLSLTSLIDAFSIIVIYLLIGTQGGGMEADIPHQISLPKAEQSTMIEEKASIVRILKGQYFIDDQPVSAKELGAKLYELKKLNGTEKEMAILVQGDKEMNYSDLDPILRAGAEAGIQKLKFAVVPNQ